MSLANNPNATGGDPQYAYLMSMALHPYRLQGEIRRLRDIVEAYQKHFGPLPSPNPFTERE